jgi:hypothetical protein
VSCCAGPTPISPGFDWFANRRPDVEHPAARDASSIARSVPRRLVCRAVGTGLVIGGCALAVSITHAIQGAF